MKTMDEPDWDQALVISVTPATLARSLFSTASSVHTGWSSCVDSSLAISDLIAIDERNGNYARLVEQEFFEEEAPDEHWHDWTVEIRIGDVFVTGHWQIQVSAAQLDWEWCSRDAETAFDKATVLVGKRARRVMTIDEDAETPPAKSQHH
jgi:hypothetical protein